MKKLTLVSQIRKNPRIITKRTNEGVILLDPILGEIRTLNKTASFTWQALDKKITVEEITQKIAKNFEAPGEKIKRETMVFLEKYLKLGLIEIKNK